MIGYMTARQGLNLFEEKSPTLADCDHPIARTLKSWPSLVVEPRSGYALPAFHHQRHFLIQIVAPLAP